MLKAFYVKVPAGNPLLTGYEVGWISVIFNKRSSLHSLIKTHNYEN